MRLILIDGPEALRERFYPITLSRPVWELRCGITNLAEKLIAKLGARDVACFVPEYMGPVVQARTSWKVNDPATLTGDDLLIVHGTMKAADFAVAPTGKSEVGVSGEGHVLYARIAREDLGKVRTCCIDSLLESAKLALPNVACALPRYNYVWEVMLASPHQIIADFKAIGKTGVEGTVEQPNAVRGSKGDIFIAKGALVHPMVVLDAANGPIFLDEGVEVHPFTRIEGPCFVGKKSLLLGAKCREGMSIGPLCKVGGEVEESVIHGYSNKYHDGFLGHAYVGEWVNLGAFTTNSDLKNDYSSVQVIMDGKNPLDTGSTKVGAIIGDHTKTSIGTLFNTGAYVGAMCLIMATGKPLSKFLPSFAWVLDGLVTKGFGKGQLYETAKMAMSRRKCQWTEADEKMWDAVYEMTAGPRMELVKKGRKAMLGK